MKIDDVDVEEIKNLVIIEEEPKKALYVDKGSMTNKWKSMEVTLLLSPFSNLLHYFLKD